MPPSATIADNTTASAIKDRRPQLSARFYALAVELLEHGQALGLDSYDLAIIIGIDHKNGLKPGGWDMTYGDIAKTAMCSEAAVKRHLAKLKDKQLVEHKMRYHRGRKCGVVYSFKPLWDRLSTKGRSDPEEETKGLSDPKTKGRNDPTPVERQPLEERHGYEPREAPEIPTEKNLEVGTNASESVTADAEPGPTYQDESSEADAGENADPGHRLEEGNVEDEEEEGSGQRFEPTPGASLHEQDGHVWQRITTERQFDTLVFRTDADGFVHLHDNDVWGREPTPDEQQQTEAENCVQTVQGIVSALNDEAWDYDDADIKLAKTLDATPAEIEYSLLAAIASDRSNPRFTLDRLRHSFRSSLSTIRAVLERYREGTPECACCHEYISPTEKQRYLERHSDNGYYLCGACA